MSLLIVRLLRLIVYLFKVKNYLNYLSKDEKEILRFYFAKKERSQPVDESNSAAMLLIKHGVLRIETDIPLICGANGFFKELVICDWPWKYLKKHQNLIDIEKGIEEFYPVD